VPKYNVNYMKNPERYTNYNDFFPFYLREHRKQSTRVFHYFGTIAYQVLFWTLIATQNFLFIPLILLAGYGPAWVSHFFIEKNKPATFKYPLWSLMGDHHMVWLMLTGKLKKKLNEAGVSA